jgi:hypothetical protein
VTQVWVARNMPFGRAWFGSHPAPLSGWPAAIDLTKSPREGRVQILAAASHHDRHSGDRYGCYGQSLRPSRSVVHFHCDGLWCHAANGLTSAGLQSSARESDSDLLATAHPEDLARVWWGPARGAVTQSPAQLLALDGRGQYAT